MSESSNGRGVDVAGVVDSHGVVDDPVPDLVADEAVVADPGDAGARA